LEFHLNKYSKW